MGVNVTISLTLSDTIVTSALIKSNLNKLYDLKRRYQEGDEPVPEWLEDAIQEKERIHKVFDDAIFSGQRNYWPSYKDGNQRGGSENG